MEIVDKNKLIELGYLKEVAHSNNELFLYNYTPKAQFDKAWETYPQLLKCRGLVLDSKGKCVARSFEKFFNFEEYRTLPSYNSFEITDKLDGSLGIIFTYKLDTNVCTRGSFNSDQAQFAKNYIKRKGIDGLFNPVYTYLVEIIYPENRIVIDYKEEKLVLLAIFNTQTGEEKSREFVEKEARELDLDVVEKFDGIKDFRHCRELLKRDNAEGFVVKLDSGLRIKLKYAEYVKLHKLMTGISERDILDMIRNKQDISKLLDKVPDEYYKWVHITLRKINNQYKAYENIARIGYEQVKDLSSRKEQAIAIMQDFKQVSSIVFKILDKKEYDDIIYKMIEVDSQKYFSMNKEDKQ